MLKRGRRYQATRRGQRLSLLPRPLRAQKWLCNFARTVDEDGRDWIGYPVFQSEDADRIGWGREIDVNPSETVPAEVDHGARQDGDEMSRPRQAHLRKKRWGFDHIARHFQAARLKCACPQRR